MKAKTKNSYGTKPLFVIAGIALCLTCCFLPVPSSLAQAANTAGSTGVTAMRVLGITCLAIIWWSGQVMQDWLVSLVMLILWVTLCGFPFNVAFSAYSGSSIWLIVGAFCLSAAISKTGFFKRISLFLLRLFSPTFRGQVLALLLTGAICSPLLPSATAKAVLGVSIAKNVADAMEYPSHSHGRYGLFMAAFIGYASTTPAFMSAGVSAYILFASLPEAFRSEMSWATWFSYTFLWLLIVLVGSFLAIQCMFSPESGSTLKAEYVQKEYQKLGRMDTQELLSALLLVTAFVLWVLENQLNINASITALGVAVLCFACRILDGKDLATSVPWNLVIFLGGVLNLGSVFTKTGIDIWLQDILASVFLHIQSPFLFVLAVGLIVLALRLILVSQTATITIMMAVLTPVATALGIHPFILGFTVLSTQGSWFLSYQNTVYTAAISCMQETVEHQKTILLCAIFETLSLGGCLCSVPFWKFCGLL